MYHSRYTTFTSFTSSPVSHEAYTCPSFHSGAIFQLSRERGTTTIVTTHYVDEAKGAARVSLSLSPWHHATSIKIFIVNQHQKTYSSAKFATRSASCARAGCLPRAHQQRFSKSIRQTLLRASSSRSARCQYIFIYIYTGARCQYIYMLQLIWIIS